jgi:hypothetical protein
MAETHILSHKSPQVCEYCGCKYVPSRRNQQKFCSSSCRSTAFKLKEKKAIVQQGKKEKNYIAELEKQLESARLDMNKKVKDLQDQINILNMYIQELMKKKGK